MRILITGGPKVGKSTLASLMSETLQIPSCRSTDDLLVLQENWNETTDRIVEWLRRPGPWIVEGVKVPHALVRFAELYPGEVPADKFIYLTRPIVIHTTGQDVMTKGVRTVFERAMSVINSSARYVDARIVAEELKYGLFR